MVIVHVVFLVLLLGTSGFFFVLEVINLSYGRAKVREQESWLRSAIGVDDVDRLLDYQRAKTGFSSLQSGINLAVALLLLYSGVFTDAVEFLHRQFSDPLMEGVLFFVGATTLGLLASSPFSAFQTFVIEQIFGFNQQSVSQWFLDLGKQLLIGMVMTAIMAGALLWVIEVMPTTWWIAGWGLFVGFGLLMQIVYPRVIAPLFNDFEPVSEGELRTAVEDVFDRAGFQCSQVYTMDASRRSSHSNAYFTGFGRTKRVVLFDTLIDQMGLNEIQAVLSHELAHWKKGHVWKRIGRQALRLGIVFGVLFWLLESSWIYGMFELPRGLPYAGLAVSSLWLGPAMQWLAPIENWWSLHDEREADRFSVDVMGGGEPMTQALYRLAEENLANPFPHPLYATFHYTHPPIPDRIQSIREYASDDQDTANAGEPFPSLSQNGSSRKADRPTSSS